MSHMSVEQGLQKIESFITSSDCRMDFQTERLLRGVCSELRDIPEASVGFRKRLAYFVDSLPGRRVWAEDVKKFLKIVNDEKVKIPFAA